MKCNKCYQTIPLNEEIKEDHKCYCESCYKSDSWKRAASTFSLWGLLAVVVILAIAAILWVKKQGEKDSKADD